MADHYWVLALEAAYDLSRVPGQESCTVAQLSDDVEDLDATAAADRQPVPWHDLAHLVGIVQRIATEDRP